MACSCTLSERNKLPLNLLLSKSNALVCHFDFWTKCASHLKLSTRKKETNSNCKRYQNRYRNRSANRKWEQNIYQPHLSRLYFCLSYFHLHLHLCIFFKFAFQQKFPSILAYLKAKTKRRTWKNQFRTKYIVINTRHNYIKWN